MPRKEFCLESFSLCGGVHGDARAAGACAYTHALPWAAQAPPQSRQHEARPATASLFPVDSRAPAPDTHRPALVSAVRAKWGAPTRARASAMAILLLTSGFLWFRNYRCLLYRYASFCMSLWAINFSQFPFFRSTRVILSSSPFGHIPMLKLNPNQTATFSWLVPHPGVSWNAVTSPYNRLLYVFLCVCIIWPVGRGFRPKPRAEPFRPGEQPANCVQPFAGWVFVRAIFPRHGNFALRNLSRRPAGRGGI
jgi:hypothetical protein